MILKTLNFHITNRCNMLCKHCLYSSGEKNIKEMSFNEIKQLINDFAIISNYQGTINLYGGEPLLRSDIFEIIDFAKSNKLNVGMTTNINVSDAILIRLSKSDISRITIDLDGGSSFTHDWLRNKIGHFEKSINAIKLFISSKKYTSVNSVMNKKNIHETESILDMCKKLNVNSINFYLFTPIGRGISIKDVMLGPEEWLLVRNRVINWIKRNKPKFGIIWECAYENILSQDNLHASLCERYSSEVVDVRCDGNVYFCGLLLAIDRISLGSIKEKKLGIILNNREKLRIKKKFGCVALALQENSNLDNLIDPRKSTNTIIPGCPYNWEMLCGDNRIIKDKFVHVVDT